VPADRVIDGMDLAPILFGTGPNQREFFCYYRGTQLYAVRQSAFKAHFITRSAYGPDSPVSRNPPRLFDLGHDAGEQIDVAASHAELLADIPREVERHRATITPVKCQLEEDAITGK
jgi:arylsulfatase A